MIESEDSPPQGTTPSRWGRYALVTDGTSGQGRSALAAVRALAAAGYRPAVTVAATGTAAAWSRHCAAAIRTPAADDPSFAASVRGIATELDAVAIFPASDSALWALDAPGVHLADKEELARRAADARLHPLPTQRFQDGPTLVRAGSSLPYPCVVKPARKLGAVEGAAALATASADLRSWEEWPTPLVVQSYVDAAMSAAFGVVWRGALAAVGMQRYLRTWPPRCGVASAAVTVPFPTNRLDQRLLRLLDGYDGIFQAQFVGPHLIDLNTRVYGSMPLALAAGLNLPGILCRLQAGVDDSDAGANRPPGGPALARVGVRYRWIEGDVRALWAMRDRPGAVGRGLIPRRKTAHSVSQALDPGPVMFRVASVVGAASRAGQRDHSRARPGRGGPVADGDSTTANTLCERTDLGLTRRELLLLSRMGPEPDQVPDAETSARRRRGFAAVRLAVESAGGSVREPLLSPAWSNDVDVALPRASVGMSSSLDPPGPGAGLPLEPPAPGMEWLPLDPLLARLGSSARGQFLLVEAGDGLIRLDTRPGSDTDPVRRVLERAAGLRGPGPREVLELRRLVAAGHTLPDSPVCARAAALEALAGGAILHDAPRSSWIARTWVRRRPRKPRMLGGGGKGPVVVSFSGLDGAGKSTQVERLRRSLEAGGIRVRVVWSRPGMGLDAFRGARRVAKRLLRQSQEPGVRAIGRGDGVPRSRKGLVGRIWRSMVAAHYGWSARAPAGSDRAVVIYDRHVLDAIATLVSAYAADADGLEARALRRSVPAPDLGFLLEVPVEEAVRRKPDAVFSEGMLRSQQLLYDRAAEFAPDLIVLDGRDDPDQLARAILARVASLPPSAG